MGDIMGRKRKEIEQNQMLEPPENSATNMERVVQVCSGCNIHDDKCP